VQRRDGKCAKLTFHRLTVYSTVREQVSYEMITNSAYVCPSARSFFVTGTHYCKPKSAVYFTLSVKRSSSSYLLSDRAFLTELLSSAFVAFQHERPAVSISKTSPRETGSVPQLAEEHVWRFQSQVWRESRLGTTSRREESLHVVFS
jgi:hypothetical protein